MNHNPPTRGQIVADPRIDAENYFGTGDRIIAVPRSTKGDVLHGRLVEIAGQDLGRRSFVVEAAGHTRDDVRTTVLQESHFIFEVERGDSWVQVPPYLLFEVAEAKAKRSLVNTRKRVERKAPLFADQIEIVGPSPEQMIARAARHRHEALQREHEQAMQSNELRRHVQELVTSEQFATLVNKRTRFPRSPLYGVYFWRKQAEHIRETGEPEIYVPPASIGERLKIEWLKPDKDVQWLSAIGPRRVRVRFQGTASVLVKIVGQPITDYDPREFPYGNVWVCIEELRPATGNSATVSITRCGQQNCDE